MAQAHEIAHFFENFFSLPCAGEGVSLGSMRHRIAGGSPQSLRIMRNYCAFFYAKILAIPR